MHEKESELRKNPPDESYLEQVVKMNLLFSHGLITKNERRIALGGKSIGVAGDRFATEDSSPIARDPFGTPQPKGV